MKNKIINILASFFGLGYLPLMPGTWGSLAGVGIFCLLGSHLTFVVLAGIFTLLGFFISDLAAKTSGVEDPQYIVLDEVTGQMITFLFVPFNVVTVITGFILFRFFDIKKPLGINSLQKIKGGAGIMLDDILAGVYANIVLQIIIRVHV